MPEKKYLSPVLEPQRGSLNVLKHPFYYVNTPRMYGKQRAHISPAITAKHVALPNNNSSPKKDAISEEFNTRLKNCEAILKGIKQNPEIYSNIVKDFEKLKEDAVEFLNENKKIKIETLLRILESAPRYAADFKTDNDTKYEFPKSFQRMTINHINVIKKNVLDPNEEMGCHGDVSKYAPIQEYLANVPAAAGTDRPDLRVIKIVLNKEIS